jgi:signal peptidase I
MFRSTAWEWTKTILTAVLISMLLRTYVVEARWIPSESMVPTFQVGDRLLVEKISLKTGSFHRGDIVVFDAPQTSGMTEAMIKRIVGLPGDILRIQNGVLYVNGTPLDEPYVVEKAKYNFGPFTVPENDLFVMGDNRNNSFDSRYWGPLSKDLVIGKAVIKFYPFHDIGLINHK